MSPQTASSSSIPGHPGAQSQTQLTLVNRYQAAWNEHGVRVAQRQSVAQMYLAATAILFGFWFQKSEPERDGLAGFLVGAVSFLTLSSAAMIWVHNRVMQHLSRFMSDCEMAASKSIEAEGNGVNLFYFCDPSKGRVKRFHAEQRSRHRIVLMLILVTTNGTALWLTRNRVDVMLFVLCFAATLVSGAIIFLNRQEDDGRGSDD
jgi:hypothetical protein